MILDFFLCTLFCFVKIYHLWEIGINMPKNKPKRKKSENNRKDKKNEAKRADSKKQDGDKK
jgi:hypothetical protein